MNPTEQALDPAQEVRRAIAALLPVHKGFEDGATLTSLGFDSLDPIELALDLEEALDIYIDVDEFPRGCTVADVIALVEGKLPRTGATGGAA